MSDKELKPCDRNAALDEVMPKIYELVSDQIVIGNVVNFETIRKAINDLKDTRTKEEEG